MRLGARKQRHSDGRNQRQPKSYPTGRRLLAPDQAADGFHAYICGKQEEARRDQLLRAQFRLF
jgi:hypothetical protein